MRTTSREMSMCVSIATVTRAMIPWPHIVLHPSLCIKSTPRSPSGVTGSVTIAPYMSACPRGSNMRPRRSSSRCSRAHVRFATIVSPGIGSTPAVTTRSGSPAACASMTDTRRQSSGGSHARARATSTRRRLAPEDGYFFRCSFVSPCSDRVLFTVAAAMRSAVPSERPRSFSPSLMCSYCRSRFGDHECWGMSHLRDSALHVACAARTVMRTVEQRRPSYRALFSIPGIPRLVASMLLARTAGQMTSLILVLFALERYGSPTIAGLATFLSIAPGLLVSPIAGALLDRHGRTRLVVLDYSVAAISLALLGALGIADALPVPLLLVIVTVTSLTFPLSHTGVRTLFPILVPQHLWERANAIDSNGYVVSSVFGPAAAGPPVAALGAPYALFVPAAISAVAAGIAVGLRDPSTRTDTGQLLADAWRGLVYVVRHPSLRALALGISLANVGWGIFFIALPVLVYTRLGGDAAYVGNLFALLGVVGFLAVLLFGRVSTRRRDPRQRLRRDRLLFRAAARARRRAGWLLGTDVAAARRDLRRDRSRKADDDERGDPAPTVLRQRPSVEVVEGEVRDPFGPAEDRRELLDEIGPYRRRAEQDDRDARAPSDKELAECADGERDGDGERGREHETADGDVDVVGERAEIHRGR